MTIKRNYSYVLSLLISVLFVSCWDSFEERNFYSANINKFSFDAHDTCPGIQNFVFNIDQYHGVAADTTTGFIQNLDSLPYGSVVNSLYPKVTFQSTNGNIYINDSLWEDGDSIDFTNPIVIKNTSYDGLYTKAYTVKVNVHKVDPDSMNLEKASAVLPGATALNKLIVIGDTLLDFVQLTDGEVKMYRSIDDSNIWTSHTISGLTKNMNLLSLCLFKSQYYIISKDFVYYRSSNGLDWTVIQANTTDGNTTIIALYGEIRRKYKTEDDPSTLIGLIKSNGIVYFGKSADGITWKKGTEVPVDFPFADYALISDTTATNIQYYTIANGLNAVGQPTASVWATEDGLNWIQVNTGKIVYNTLPNRKNAVFFKYDGFLVSFGGQDDTGAFYKDMYVSPDHGKTWRTADNNWAFFKMDSGLAGAGVYVQHIPDLVNNKDSEFIWILGGTRSDGASSTIWKGYLNNMIFSRR